jgi:putative transposase
VSKRTYHVWFSTKYRRAALVDEIAETIDCSFKDTASKVGIVLVEIALEFDHAHLLLELPDSMPIASAMHRLKGASAREVFRLYPELRLDMRARSFWQEGYGSREVPHAQVEAVSLYIRTQSERPPRHSQS